MNPIENDWHQLKSHEISGRMFDNEYDLAKAVMAGMESRSIAGEYALDRFIFNSAQLLSILDLIAIFYINYGTYGSTIA